MIHKAVFRCGLLGCWHPAWAWGSLLLWYTVHLFMRNKAQRDALIHLLCTPAQESRCYHPWISNPTNPTLALIARDSNYDICEVDVYFFDKKGSECLLFCMYKLNFNTWNSKNLFLTCCWNLFFRKALPVFFFLIMHWYHVSLDDSVLYTHVTKISRCIDVCHWYVKMQLTYLKLVQNVWTLNYIFVVLLLFRRWVERAREKESRSESESESERGERASQRAS